MEEKLEMGEDSTSKITMISKIFKTKRPNIGMIHLPPLPGYPNHLGMDAVIKKALKDLQILQNAGFNGVLVENDSDQPHQIGVSQTIIKAFTQVMEKVVKKAKIPVGMEIIYDMLETIKVAKKVKAQFVRLDVFVDNVETKWGKIPAQAEEIVRLKKRLHVNNLLLFTDIQVKHAKMLDKKTLEQSTREAMAYGSNALIITGSWTGLPPSLADCKKVKKIANIPVLVGSGLTAKNANILLKYCDGAIVGTSIKTGNSVDYKKARELIKATQSNNL